MTADSVNDFRRKNEAQFDKVERDLHLIGRLFVYYMADQAVRKTPGFEGPGFTGQYEKTRYIPTGRLRGGWGWTVAPIGSSSKGVGVGRHEHGPFSAYGGETLLKIDGQLPQRLPPISYLENDVGYGYDIVRGERNHAHIGVRDFPLEASKFQTTALQHALAAWRRAT